MSEAMLYLIDGYNLMHHMGAIPARTGPKGLEHARLRLLGTLRAAFGDEASSVTVVFDAAGARPGATEIHNHHGIEVRFAIHQEQADDLIELLIRKDAAPRHLSVVSDDHRVQRAARRRHCLVLGCGDFLDLLERRCRPAKSPPEARTKPEVQSSAETQHWLREFGALENDPDFKEVFNPFDFDEDKS